MNGTGLDVSPDMDPEAVLAHYGVKGMRWGYTRRENQIQRLERVGSGTGSKTDKAIVGLQTSAWALHRQGGLKGAAANKAANMRIRDKRIAEGNASVKDILIRYGTEKVFDTGRVDSGRRFTPDSAKITPKPGVSSTTKKVIEDHNNLSDRDFMMKYATTKKVYAKRVEKYGDPYARRTGKMD